MNGIWRNVGLHNCERQLFTISPQRPLEVDVTILTPSETLFYERQLFTTLSTASMASPNCTFSGPPAENAWSWFLSCHDSHGDNSKDTKAKTLWQRQLKGYKEKTIWQRQLKGNERKDNMTGGIRTIPVPGMMACSSKQPAALSRVANLRKTTFGEDDFNDCDGDWNDFDGPVCTFFTLQNEIVIFIFWTLSRLTLWRGCGCKRTHNL